MKFILILYRVFIDIQNKKKYQRFLLIFERALQFFCGARLILHLLLFLTQYCTMMKYLSLFLIIFSSHLFSQKQHNIELNLNISNGMFRDYHSLEVLDLRDEETVGKIFENKVVNHINFETNAKTDIENWFKKYNNGKKGDSQLFMILHQLKSVRVQAKDGRLIAATSLKASTFQKKENKYRFLYKKDTLIFYQGSDVSKSIVKDIHSVLFRFIHKTYHKKPSDISFTENELKNFEEIYSKKLPAIVNDQVKEGIYEDYESFFNQTPTSGTVEKLDFNKKGNLDYAIVTENSKSKRFPARKVYAFTNLGKVYKNIECGLDGSEICSVEILKNNKGFYTINKREALLPINVSNNYALFGVLAFGIVGGVVGGLIDDSSAQKSKHMDIAKDKNQEFYIDSLTGNFIFDK